MERRVGKVILPILIVAVAVAAVAFMMANPVTPDRLEVDERIVPVEVVEVVRSSEQVTVEAQGTVMAARQVQVRPEVSGRIVELSASLVPGGRFAAGETLVRIDDRDYRAQLVARREAVAGARLALRQARADQAVAEEEWRRLEGSVSAAATDRDLVLRVPQIERAEAAVAAAEAALAKAELDVERCTVTAPFSAIVLREQVALGQLVGRETAIATLVGSDAYWVQASLPVEHLAWIETPHGGRRGSAAAVVHRAGAVEIRRQGRVERLLGDVDPAGRMARLLVVIDDPLSLRGPSEGLPLLIGSYVTVEIQGRTVDDAVVIPRRALREVPAEGGLGARQGLWIMDADDRLSIRAAEVVWRDEETVIVAEGRPEGAPAAGLAVGDRLITSTLATPIEGMKLSARPAGDAAGDAPGVSAGGGDGG